MRETPWTEEHDRQQYLVPATSNLSTDNPRAVTEHLDGEVTLEGCKKFT